ncbi:MAG: type II toxin-antitoxin system prevent-host-death family antitoxin [Legionellaceae bacterium]|nr:type II toxin-antitoxin system prevent-host-death family antitoxin [Legionellaceae bacterium]
MQFVNIHDAKTNLSKYLEQIQVDHEMIVICKNGKPVAQLTTYKGSKKRVLGALKGKIKIADDFDTLPEDFEAYFK